MKTEIVSKSKIACYGASPSSHPKVWLALDPQSGEAVCPYCEIKYILDKDAKKEEH